MIRTVNFFKKVLIYNSSDCTETSGESNLETNINWALDLTTSPVDGTKHVSFKVEDEAGRISACSTTPDSIIYDTTAPSATSLAISGDLAPHDYTSLATVKLDLAFVEANPDRIEFYETDDCSDPAIVTKNFTDISNINEISYTFSSATNEEKIVSYKVIDKLEMVSGCKSDSIIYDNTNPIINSFAITGNHTDSELTSDADVTLTIAATEANHDVIGIYDGNTCTGSPRVTSAYSGGDFAFALPAANGNISVSIKLLDKVGKESSCKTDSIYFDDAAPTATSITIKDSEGNEEFTNNSEIIISLYAEDQNIDRMLFTNVEDTCQNAALDNPLWATYSADDQTPFAPPSLNDENIYYARFIDTLGNMSNCISASIIHDGIPPGVSSKIMNLSSTLNTAAFSWAAADDVVPDSGVNSGIGDYEVAMGVEGGAVDSIFGWVFIGAPDLGYIIDTGTTNMNPNLKYSASVRARDRAGNVSPSVDINNAPIDSYITSELFEPLSYGSFASSFHHNCAILLSSSDNPIKCWGNNSYGQLGVGDTNHRGDDESVASSPIVPLTGPFKAAQVALGGNPDLVTPYYYSCALSAEGGVRCWGTATNGALGQHKKFYIGDDTEEDELRMLVSDLSNINLGENISAVQIAAKFGHNCAVLNNGDVKCWGSNGLAQLGVSSDKGTQGRNDNGLGANMLPVDLGHHNNNVDGKRHTALSVAVGKYHSCALLDDGNVKCWGLSTHGELGIVFPSLDYEGSPTLAPIGTGIPVGKDRIGDIPEEMGNNLPYLNLGNHTVVRIEAAYHNTCFQFDNGTMACIGENSQGQLGLDHQETLGYREENLGDNFNLAGVSGIKSIGMGTNPLFLESWNLRFHFNKNNIFVS